MAINDYTPAQVRKTIVAGIGTLVTGIGTAMLDGALTGAESITALGAALVAAGIVFYVPNAPSDKSGDVMQEPDDQ